jgi:ABC-type lipoprotein export system ATPase subunit
VFQFHQLLPEFTALENIMLPALLGGTSKKEAKQRAEELLEFMGLTDRAKHKPNELSGGEKQRVAVARALVNHPSIILADEPSGSLDSQNKKELHQLFFDLRDRMGQTFIIVTHDEELAATTDRTIHLKDGMVQGETVGAQETVDTKSIILGKMAQPDDEEVVPHRDDSETVETTINQSKNEEEDLEAENILLKKFVPLENKSDEVE